MEREHERDAIRARVHVTRADVADAKAFILTRQGHDVDPWMNDWMTHNSLEHPHTVVLSGPDLESALDTAARYLTLRLTFLEALQDLLREGVLWPAGGDHDWSQSLRWIFVHTPGSRRSSGWTFDEFLVRTPGRVRRIDWSDLDPVVVDGDLVLREIGVPDLHEGVAQALRESARCLRAGLYLPAIAMLGAASEGAWVELGHALASVHPTYRKAEALASALDDPRTSTASKITETAALYDKGYLGRGHFERHIKGQLEGVRVWSDLVRDGRNALHWGKDAAVPNSYDKVATLLLAAVPNIRLLYRVRAKALAAAREAAGGER